MLVQVKGLQVTTGHIYKTSLQEAIRQIIQREGVRALWQFTKQWQHRFPSASKSQDAVLRRLVAGGGAGMLACSLVSHSMRHLILV